MLISRLIQSTSVKGVQFFFILYLSGWSTDASSETHTQEWRQRPCYFSLCRNMTLSFTSFSIKDILAGRDVRGPAGEISTGGRRPSQPAAGNLCADIQTSNFSLGDLQQERADILSGNSEDTTKLSDAKGEQQIRHIYTVLLLFDLTLFCR